MNGMQHLTTPTSLKFCLALCFSSSPKLLKSWPQLSPGWPQLFSFGERDGNNLFRARANPASANSYSSEESKFGKGLMCLLLDAFLKIQAKLLSSVLAGTIKCLCVHPYLVLALLNAPQDTMKNPMDPMRVNLRSPGHEFYI